ncbi:TPA: ferritin [Candidatus Dependentiae bacterium]|nr:MAG: Ferritin Dps family protein [candidate division TM6 bacterium GW2011_GWE2_31_21]KKP54079.1 MAG: Ferritin Dps family protein [candidate division TM6 bacterium GW2011_GWF2_33_332]HBS48339.1 ferritin [Candidatus Dependentiae bacterium]HBZ72987.1 ferritin [Candidatus Dependentiae bacterium]
MQKINKKGNSKWIWGGILGLFLLGGAFFYLSKKGLSKAEQTKAVELLNKVLADEWFANYQYWLGSKLAKGPMSKEVSALFTKYSDDEFNNANKIVDKILLFEGNLPLEPKIWYEISKCGYSAPIDTSTKNLLEQAIKREKCAVEFFKEITDFIGTKDVEVLKIIQEISDMQNSHITELQNLLELVQH